MKEKITLLLLIIGIIIPISIKADNIASGTSGTCIWMITEAEDFIIKPKTGDECTLDNINEGHGNPYNFLPWKEHISKIKNVHINVGTVKANKVARGMFYNIKADEIDLTGFDTSQTEDMFGMFEYTRANHINLSNISTKKATKMIRIFQGSKFKKITFGNNFDFKINENVYSGMFGRGLWRKGKESYNVVQLIQLSKKGKLKGTYEKTSSDSTGLIKEDFAQTHQIIMSSTTKIKTDSVSCSGITGCQLKGEKTIVINAGVNSNSYNNDKDTALNISGSSSVSFTLLDAAQDLNTKEKLDVKYTISNINVYGLKKEKNQVYKLAVFFNGHFGAIMYDATDSQNWKMVKSKKKFNGMAQDIEVKLIDKKGKVVKGTYAFRVYDLDIPNPAYTTYDKPAGNPNSEGVNLISGFDENTFRHVEDKYTLLRTMRLKNKRLRIYGSAYDGGSELSEFSIQAKTEKTKFTWTAPSGAETFIFFRDPSEEEEPDLPHEEEELYQIVYRTIDLNNPFLGTDGKTRTISPLSNWYKKENTIDKNVYSGTPQYTVVLTPTDIKKIREYNREPSNVSYDKTTDASFDKFKKTFSNIFK